MPPEGDDVRTGTPRCPVMTPSTVTADNPYPQVWGPPATLATRSDNLVCAMVGFFYGSPCKVFNVGEYVLRLVDGKFQRANFFDENNLEAKALRRKASENAVQDLCEWMSGRKATKRKYPSQLGA
eukprot:g21227.t1